MKTRKNHAYHALRQILAGLLLGLAAIIQVAIPAPITLNLHNADINDIIAQVSEITGKNFIVDPRVKGTVNVVLAKPLEKGEVYELFLSILSVHGFAAVPGDKFIKIVPAANAKQQNIPTLDRTTRAQPDQAVTRLIPVQHVSAAQIVPILRPLLPPTAHLAASGNALIVSATAGNVERIGNIIRRVDVSNDRTVDLIPLYHASATDLVRTLTALEQARATPISRSQLVADERTNSILVTGDSASRLRLRILIVHLDIPLEGNGDTEVIHLRHRSAKDLESILQGVRNSLEAK